VALAAEVEVGWARGERLPTARGELRIQRLAFTRNIDLGTTLGQLSRTQRAEVSRYDPEADRVLLDLRIADEQPFVVRNNLVEAELAIDDSQRPFRIVGTDQRFGVLGNLEFTRGRIFFRNAVFELTRGTLAFDDETRIDPSFQLAAVTDVRRGGDLQAARWRIMLDARGSMGSFQIGTRSDPDLPQEDILMLLAVGMTRGEFEQLRTGDLTGTAALEALSQITGVDREVRRAVPLIDDFRITSAYSLRSGRTEPQVSIGKRITDRVRLSATTGVGTGDSRDFRALVDVQLDRTAGVQCSYDNFTTSGSASSFGNVGCDLRWRLEFE
jgi:translocation and assembly module TamB